MVSAKILLERENHPTQYTGNNVVDICLFMINKFLSFRTFLILSIIYLGFYLSYGSSELLLKCGAIWVIFLILGFLIENILLIKFGTIQAESNIKETWEKFMEVSASFAWLFLCLVLFALIFELIPINFFSYHINFNSGTIIIPEKLAYILYFMAFMGVLPFIVIGLMVLLYSFKLFTVFIENVIFPYILLIGSGLLLITMALLYISAAVDIILSLLPIYFIILLILYVSVMLTIKK